MYLLKLLRGSFLRVLSAAKGRGEFSYGAASYTYNRETPTTPFPSISGPAKKQNVHALLSNETSSRVRE